jgi:hypothetical protein
MQTRQVFWFSFFWVHRPAGDSVVPTNQCSYEKLVTYKYRDHQQICPIESTLSAIFIRGI